ncbi:MAG: DUF3737 family protein [Clostridia bacterium]|nr:DUF3737 family protein [Clostridia bacterium]
MQVIEQQTFPEERALYRLSDAHVLYSTFETGESPIKEAHDASFEHCLFKWRYPVWYSQRIDLAHCTIYADARAGVWYCEDVRITDSSIAAPKCIRRCKNTTLSHVSIPNGVETCWHCDGLDMHDVSIVGDYFCMNSENIRIDGLELTGKYSFDGVRHVDICNAHMVTKDAFWNSEDVYVRDSVILGEYIGWNSKNITFENCVIDSLQGLCYIDGIRLINCRLVNTSFAFEYSVVDATVHGRIDSVFNPTGGRIEADAIGELIMEKDKATEGSVDILAQVERRSDKPTW